MTQRFGRSSLLVAVLVLVPLLATAQDWKGNARLKGKIVDEDGKGVRDAQVTLLNAEVNAGPAPVKTNRGGNFEVRDLRPGQWRVEVRSEDHAVRRTVIDVLPTGETEVELNVVRRGGTAQAQEINALLAKGDQAYAAGQFAQAREEYFKVLEARPDLTQVQRSIAYSFGREGNHKKALEHFDLVLEARKTELAALPEGGEAAPSSGSAAELDPTAITEILVFAMASSMEVGDYERLKSYLAQVDDTTLDGPDMMSQIALGLLNKGRSADSVVVLDRLVTAFPGAAFPYYLRGMAKLKMDRNEEAVPDLEKFIAIAPADLAPQVDQVKGLLEKLKG